MARIGDMNALFRSASKLFPVVFDDGDLGGVVDGVLCHVEAPDVVLRKRIDMGRTGKQS